MQAILDASREKEHRYNKFMAAINGIDIDEKQNNAQERFDEVQRRAEAKLTGKNKEALDLDVFAFDFETEE